MPLRRVMRVVFWLGALIEVAGLLGIALRRLPVPLAVRVIAAGLVVQGGSLALSRRATRGCRRGRTRTG